MQSFRQIFVIVISLVQTIGRAFHVAYTPYETDQFKVIQGRRWEKTSNSKELGNNILTTNNVDNTIHMALNTFLGFYLNKLEATTAQ